MLLGIVVGYLIGTFPSADLVARLVSRGAVDIRQSGSGNPGGLNTMRVLGRSWGALVMLLDTLKGVVAGFVGLAIGDAAAYAAGTAAIAGHVWPVWTRFRGGRGRRDRRWLVPLGVPALLPDRGGVRPRGDPDPARPALHGRPGVPAVGGGRRGVVGAPTCRTGGAPSPPPASSCTRCWAR